MLMKILSRPNRIFALLHRQKALRMLVLLVGLLLVGTSVSAQSRMDAMLADTARHNPADMFNQYVNIVTCLDRAFMDHVFTLRFYIQRIGGAGTGTTHWGLADGADWTFPTTGWAVASVTNVGTVTDFGGNPFPGYYDRVELQILYNRLLEGNENAILGGTFRVDRPDQNAYATITVHLRPAATVVDTIFTDPSPFLCQGEAVRFYTNVGGTLTDGPYFTTNFLERYFVWEIFDDEGTPIYRSDPPVLLNNTAPAELSISALVGFDPQRHHTVTVRRAFCNPFGLIDRPQLAKELNLEEDRFSISNPPLDTSAANRQDTLLRLAWIGSAGEEVWASIPMQSSVNPICVNYGQMPTQLPNNFRSSNEANPSQDPATVAGFLFFQVGTQPDTMVRYIWYYDPDRLERVFVGQTAGEDGLLAWWIPGIAEGRWSRLLDGTDEDEWTSDNFGGFGHPSLPSTDSSYRAAFRVRALAEDDPRRWDDITVSVRPICAYCIDQYGQPFQNRLLEGNIGRAFDTVRPISQFDILTILDDGSPLGLPRSDTACIRTTLSFRALPHDSITSAFGAHNWWNIDSLLYLFNIEQFGGYTHPLLQGMMSANIVPGAGGDALLTGNAILNVTVTHRFTPLWTTFSPQNRCFTRAISAPTQVTVEGRPQFQLQPHDQPWHQIRTFFVQRSALPPLVIDPALNRPMTVNDTIFICRRRIMDSIGVGYQAGAELGLTYILAMRNEAGQMQIDPGLVHSTDQLLPGVLASGNLIWPSSGQFFGFYNPPGYFGNPVGFFNSFWEHYAGEPGTPEEDPYQRMFVRFNVPNVFTGEYQGELVFAAQDACGRGDSIAIPFVIIDTVPLDPVIAYTPLNFGEITFAWENLASEDRCEGETLFHRVRHLSELDRNRGGSIQWGHPDSWIRGAVSTGNIAGNDWNQLELKFGRDTGEIWVNSVNRCGGTQRIFSPVVEPIPYFRVEPHWLEFHPEVCQDSVYIFSWNHQPFVGLMSNLYIQFPEHWRIHQNITGALSPARERRDTILEGQLFHNPLFVPFTVSVHDSIGNWGEILIRWLDQRCDVGPNARPEYWDTTRIFMHTFPLAPLPYDGWGDSIFCLRDTVWLSVESAPKDTIQENNYFWEFPTASWQVVGWGSRGPNSDSVRVVVGSLGQSLLGEPLEVDTIRVEARSTRCRATDIPFLFQRQDIATLRMPVWIMDTAVFVLDSLLDAAREYYQFVSDVCEPAELRLFVNQTYWLEYHTVYATSWRWGADEDNIDNDVSIYPAEDVLADWRFFSRNDTLAVYLEGGDEVALYLQLVMQNRCGTSRSEPIILTVADADISDVQIRFIYPDYLYDVTDETVEFCEGDLVTLSVYAFGTTNFLWTFPWYPFVRTTTTNTIELEIPEEMYADSVNINGPYIRVRAFNTCDTTDLAYSAFLEVTNIWPAPRAPRIYGGSFGQRGTYIDLGGNDWIIDTVCLRQQLSGWQVAVNEDDYNEYTGDWAPFHWTIFGTAGVGASNDINVIFDFTSSTDSSTFDVLAQDASIEAGTYNTWIGVSVARERCSTAQGEMLRIRLTSVDTIPVSGLIGIVPDPPFEPNYRPCPGSTVTFVVLNDIALGYRWILPYGDTTWSFVGHPYTVRELTGTDEIDIIIGENPGQIGIVTTTSRSDGTYFCEDHVNEEILLSELITPFPAPILDGFSAFPTHICAIDQFIPIAVAVNSETQADSTRFILHKYRLGQNIVTLDTTLLGFGLMLDPLDDWAFDSIVVTAEVISIRCTTYMPEPRVSNQITDRFGIFNSPRISLLGGSLHPCRNVEQTYTIELSDPGVTFTFTHETFPPSSAEVTLSPSGPSEQPQIINVNFLLNSDSIEFSFVGVSPGGGCLFPSSDTVITARANTTPGAGFYFEVTYHAFVCPDVLSFPLQIANTGIEIVFEADWYLYVVNPEDITDTTFTQLATNELQIWQSVPQGKSTMNFIATARYERCVTDEDGLTVVEPDYTRTFFTVTAVDPVVANISAQVVRIAGNRVDLVRPFLPEFDSILLGENLRLVGRADGRPYEFPHLIMEWWGDFETDRILFGPLPENRDTMFTGTIFSSDQRFFFSVEDTSAFGGYNPDGSTFGCINMDTVYIFIREFAESSIDDENVFGDVPNAFTPHNQDGVNDIFMPGVDEITILNRWGVVIFHAEGARAREGWDGRDSRTNRMVDRGDYFFIITIHRENVTISNDSSYIGENRRQTHSKTGVVTVL